MQPGDMLILLNEVCRNSIVTPHSRRENYMFYFQPLLALHWKRGLLASPGVLGGGIELPLGLWENSFSNLWGALICMIPD